MGSVFKKKTTRPVPAGAELAAGKGGATVARWKVRCKPRSAPVNADGTGVFTESRTYYAKYRDHTGVVVERPTWCREEQTARQKLAGWEREVEKIKAGTLDAGELLTARTAGRPWRDHLADYERSLRAAEVTDTYRANVRRGVEWVATDCGLGTLADFRRDQAERWLRTGSPTACPPGPGTTTGAPSWPSSTGAGTTAA